MSVIPDLIRDPRVISLVSDGGDRHNINDTLKNRDRLKLKVSPWFSNSSTATRTKELIELLLTGFLSILGQVVLLRELNNALYGVEIVYIIAIGMWLFWTAVGAAIGRWKSRPGKHAIHSLFLLASCLLILELFFIRGGHILFGGVRGAYLPFYLQLLLLVLAILPVGISMGLLFQWTAKHYISKGFSLARAYGIESLGGVLGGLCSTLFLVFGMQNLSIALIASILTGLVITIYSYKQRKLLATAGIVISILLLILLNFSSRLDFKSTAWNHPGVIDVRVGNAVTWVLSCTRCCAEVAFAAWEAQHRRISSVASTPGLINAPVTAWLASVRFVPGSV